ncbi:MAG TPA: hypothetical protein VM621_12410 [Luteibacter sp.]|uniref:hypothetical protein n=1 Tax=Luteibacter sp. TaxID=1886636 RepID=UPI002B6D24A5|nr:hypothetical protein [Luteibacter sp.]HVI55837.1 hypothetical protein [Luteibacter sp.]
MAGISKRVWVFVMATCGVVPLVRATEPPPVHYEIGLDVSQGEAEAITVRATVRTGDDGIVDFDPPSQRPAEVHAEGGTLDTSTDKRWRVSGVPGAGVVLSWRSPKPTPLPTVSLSAWQSVVAQPGKVFAFDGVFLAIPKGAPTRRVTTTVSLPTGWHGASGAGNRSTTVEELPSLSFIAARDLYSVTRPIGGTHTLHVAATGARTQDVDRIATVLATALGTQPKDVTLNLLIVNAGEGSGYTTAGCAAALLLPRYEPSHPWLFGLVGYLIGADDAPGKASNAWFSRGVTGYRVAMAFRANGIFDNTSLARHIDQTLDAYGGSPLRRAPNARIAEDYDRIREMHDLPAARGELFAWLIDARLREATRGRKRLTDALKRVDSASPDPGPALIAAVAAEGGGDITALYQRYIVDGQLLQLPADTLGPDFSIGTVAYDYGWQIQHVFAKPLADNAQPLALP